MLADFQQYYSIDLWAIDWDVLGEDHAAHIAALARQLPTDSRCMKSIAPASSYGIDVQLLRQIEHNQRVWHWANTKEAENKETAPEPISLPGEDEARQAQVESEQRNAIEVAAALGINI